MSDLDALKTKLRDRLEDLWALDDNWDKNGAKAITPEAYNKALDVIDRLEEYTIAPNLYLFPTVHGGLEFENDEFFVVKDITVSPEGHATLVEWKEEPECP